MCKCVNVFSLDDLGEGRGGERERERCYVD